MRVYREIAVTAAPEPTVAPMPAAMPGPAAVPPSDSFPAAAPLPSAMGDMASTPVATGTGIRWTVPEGWSAGPDRPMRLGTLLASDGTTECAITAFPGEVGGIEANLRRWLGQITVEVGAEALAQFARTPETIESDGKLPCLVYDFARVVPEGAAQSILAAIVPMESQTVFLKMTAPPATLVAERDRFLALCRSLAP